MHLPVQFPLPPSFFRWSTAALQADKKVAFDPQLVVRLYEEELAGKGDQPPAIRRLMLLEISQVGYLRGRIPVFEKSLCICVVTLITALKAIESLYLDCNFSHSFPIPSCRCPSLPSPPCVQYLENYLWPHFDEEASTEHVLSIMAMVNEKFRQTLPAWKGLQVRNFSPFLQISFQEKKKNLLLPPNRLTAFVWIAN